MRLRANDSYLSYVAFTSNATYVAMRLWGVAQLIHDSTQLPLHLYLTTSYWLLASVQRLLKIKALCVLYCLLCVLHLQPSHAQRAFLDAFHFPTSPCSYYYYWGGRVLLPGQIRAPQTPPRKVKNSISGRKVKTQGQSKLDAPRDGIDQKTGQNFDWSFFAKTTQNLRRNYMTRISSFMGIIL